MEPGNPHTTAIVLLAAGLSRRYGETDKLLAPLKGRPLVDHAAETLAAMPFARHIAVASAPGVAARLERLGFAVVINPAPQSGMGASLALGIAAASPCTCLLVCLADMPCISAAHIHHLLAAFAADPARPVATAWGEGAGPPAVLPMAQVRDMTFPGDRGARSYLAQGTRIAAPPESLRDVDTQADLARLAAII